MLIRAKFGSPDPHSATPMRAWPLEPSARCGPCDLNGSLASASPILSVTEGCKRIPFSQSLQAGRTRRGRTWTLDANADEVPLRRPPGWRRPHSFKRLAPNWLVGQPFRGAPQARPTDSSCSDGWGPRWSGPLAIRGLTSRESRGARPTPLALALDCNPIAGVSVESCQCLHIHRLCGSDLKCRESENAHRLGVRGSHVRSREAW